MDQGTKHLVLLENNLATWVRNAGLFASLGLALVSYANNYSFHHRAAVYEIGCLIVLWSTASMWLSLFSYTDRVNRARLQPTYTCILFVIIQSVLLLVALILL